MMTSREGRMPRMRALIEVDPSIPEHTRAAISRHEDRARAELVQLGLNECEAAELLDEIPDQAWDCS